MYSEILDALDETKTCIDMSTIDPSASIEIAEMVKKTGAGFIDAPVVKSKPAAIAGKLGIYVGGDEQTFEKMRRVLLYMGENVVRMGDNGKGLVMKICHNALVSQIQNGVNETITLAQRNGISVSAYAEAISYGGGQNFYLDGKAAPLKKRLHHCVFVENMAKVYIFAWNWLKSADLICPASRMPVTYMTRLWSWDTEKKISAPRLRW